MLQQTVSIPLKKRCAQDGRNGSVVKGADLAED